MANASHSTSSLILGPMVTAVIEPEYSFLELHRHIEGKQIKRVDAGELRGAHETVGAGINPHLISGDHLFDAYNHVHPMLDASMFESLAHVEFKSVFSPL